MHSRSAKLDRLQLELVSERDALAAAQRKINALQLDLSKAVSDGSILKIDLESKTSALTSMQEGYLHLSTKLKGYPRRR